MEDPHPQLSAITPPILFLPLNIPSQVDDLLSSQKRNNNSNMKTLGGFFLLSILLISASPSFATRPEPESFDHFSAQFTQSSKGKPTNPKGEDGSNDPGLGPYFGPGSGFGIPGFGKDWGNGIMGGGYGSGYGGPGGGHGKGGVIRPTVVCKEKGPCYKKKLTCPAKCFSSYSRSGKGYGAGGGGGGCTMDCKKKCIAYC